MSTHNVYRLWAVEGGEAEREREKERERELFSSSAFRVKLHGYGAPETGHIKRM